jgi:hypothetical protein
MNLKPIKIKNFSRAFVLGALSLLCYACDVLEQDDSTNSPQVEISDEKVYVLPNGSAYIDLYSKVKTLGTVKLNIAGQPRHGDLADLGSGFLQYSPDHNFKKGHDAISFSIYSANNEFIKFDSVVIIIEDDTTQLPCGIYPRNDSVYNVTGPTIINVLSNDIICGDSSDVIVEVYKPSAAFPPYAGTASVTADNKIQYTPGSGFSGTDKIIYKVYSPTDTTKIGFGIVYIVKEQACVLQLQNDYFTINRDTLQSDTLQLFVFDNDVLCGDSVNYSYTISKAPLYGKAYMRRRFAIDYIVPDSTATFTDSLFYKVCNGSQCKEASVAITIH